MRRDAGMDQSYNVVSVGVCLTNEIISNMHCRSTHLEAEFPVTRKRSVKASLSAGEILALIKLV